jgi:hypothetical protein
MLQYKREMYGLLRTFGSMGMKVKTVPKSLFKNSAFSLFSCFFLVFTV